MPSDLNVVRLMSQLTKLTAKGELVWGVAHPPHSMTDGTNDVFPIYFQTEYKGQRIGITQRRYQVYDGDRDRFFWDEQILLLFLDNMDRVVWTNPSHSAALLTLWETVRDRVADIDGILKNLLSDSDEDEL